MRHSLALICVLAACGPIPDEGEDEIDVAAPSLHGEINGSLQVNQCTPERDTAVRTAIRLGRWLAATPEYYSCVMDGYDTTAGAHVQYAACGNDDRPAAHAGYRAANSVNPVAITCANLRVNGSSFLSPFTFTGVEAISLNNAFIDASLGFSVGAQGRLAKLIWHELMHKHGFVHDGSCPSIGTSMPLIAEDCMGLTATSIARTRLSGQHSGSRLTKRVRLANAGIAAGGIASDNTMNTTIFALLHDTRITAAHSQKCLTAPAGGVGTPVTQATCPSAGNWAVLPLPDSTLAGERMRVLIMSTNGLCIDRPWGWVANHTPLQQYTCHGGPAQQFLERANGQLEAIGENGLPSGQCIDVPSESLSDGVTLQMSQCKTTNIANQVFSF